MTTFEGGKYQTIVAPDTTHLAGLLHDDLSNVRREIYEGLAEEMQSEHSLDASGTSLFGSVRGLTGLRALVASFRTVAKVVERRVPRSKWLQLTAAGGLSL